MNQLGTKMTTGGWKKKTSDKLKKSKYDTLYQMSIFPTSAISLSWIFLKVIPQKKIIEQFFF